jgi:uncharacterized protein
MSWIYFGSNGVKPVNLQCMKFKFDRQAFKEKLEAQTAFPTLYMFKFIVPNGREVEIAALLPNNKMTLKESSKGKYVSATIKAMMPNSDAILDVYERASKIEGVISL